MAGWLGRVFADRYHAEQLATPTQMQHAVRYVLTNAAHHCTTRSKVPYVDPFSSMRVSPSLLDAELPLVRPPKGFLLAKACRSQTL